MVNAQSNNGVSEQQSHSHNTFDNAEHSERKKCVRCMSLDISRLISFDVPSFPRRNISCMLSSTQRRVLSSSPAPSAEGSGTDRGHEGSENEWIPRQEVY